MALGQEAGDALEPGVDLGGVIGIGQAKNGTRVLDARKALERGPAYALGRRVGLYPVGVRRLDRFQFAQQQVVLAVADHRIVEHIVTIVVIVDLCDQLFHARTSVCHSLLHPRMAQIVHSAWTMPTRTQVSPCSSSTRRRLRQSSPS
jgi:hypothetical protein